MIIDTSLLAEVRRLVRCLPEPVDRAEQALAELLACFPVYRSYLPAGHEHLQLAAVEASHRRPDLADAIVRLVPLLSDGELEVARRFPQTTGPVMAKGVEDTAFYRFTRLGSLTEVGGDPSIFSLSVEGLHRSFARRQAEWPASMTALTTHDTKRSEDVRARPAGAGRDALVAGPTPCSRRWRGVASRHWGARDLIATSSAAVADASSVRGPRAVERRPAYVDKAVARGPRGAHLVDDPNEAFESAVRAISSTRFRARRRHVTTTLRDIRRVGWSSRATQRAGHAGAQLAAPRRPDIYQGTELWDMSLVDPDNRRPSTSRSAVGSSPISTRGSRPKLPPVDKTGAVSSS